MKAIILIALVAVAAIQAADLSGHQQSEQNMFGSNDPNPTKSLDDTYVIRMLTGTGRRPSALEISHVLDRAVSTGTFVNYQDLKQFSRRSDCRKRALQDRAFEAEQLILDRNGYDSVTVALYDMQKLLSDYARAALEETVKRCIQDVAHASVAEQEFLYTLALKYRQYTSPKAAGCPEYPATLTNYEQFILQGRVV